MHLAALRPCGSGSSLSAALSNKRMDTGERVRFERNGMLMRLALIRVRSLISAHCERVGSQVMR